MQRTILILTGVLMLAAVATAAERPAAASGNRESTASSAVPAAAPTAADIEARRLAQELRKAMNAEIHALLESEQAEVAALVAELEAAGTPEQRLEIQRRIHTAKENGRRDLLAIQLDYARQGGFSEQARDLEAKLARMEEQPAKTLPQPSTRSVRRGGDAR